MKYKSCHLLEHGIYFYFDSIQVCCLLTGKEGKPFYIIKDYKGEKIDWDYILEFKRNLRESHKKGIINSYCEGCFNLEEKEWEDTDIINNLYISHWTNCNCACNYCYTEENKEFFNSHKPYKLMPILKEMLEKNILDYKGYVAFGGGEPAVLDEFEDIVNLFLDNNIRSIVTNSSGIKYVEAIARGLSTGIVDLTVSIDCADRELYKKIKKIDAYDKVIENLKKYVQAQGEDKTKVRSKYIIIPGLNDNQTEIENWLQKSVEIGIKQVVIDVEGQWFFKFKNDLPKHMLDLISYVEDRTKELDLGLFYYSYADQIRHERDRLKLS